MADTVYYEVTGGAPLEFCRDWRERAKAVEAIYSDYAEAKGGIGYVRQLRDRFGGVIFSRQPPRGWREHKTPCRDGTYFSKPVKRGEGAVEGKAFQAEIDALPPLPSDEEFCQRFCYPRNISYSKPDGSSGAGSVTQGWHTACIAWVDDGDSFWITLPDFDAHIAHLEKQEWTVTPREWPLPEGMKRSSRARYELAQAAAKVAAEEKASTPPLAHLNTIAQGGVA